MRLATLLAPNTLRWGLRTAGLFVWDRLRGAPPLPLLVRDYVAAHARRGDPDDVLRALDRFATEVRFLMNVGPEKGPLVQELVAKLPEDARVLELGAFCGYSSILLSTRLGPKASIVSLEINEHCVECARANIEYAGLAARARVLHGPSGETIPRLEGPFDLVFLDHWKPLYERDLQAIEACGLLKPGSIVVADNVGELFGADEYLAYVRECGRYESENRPAHIEYTELPDAVEISVYRPATR